MTSKNDHEAVPVITARRELDTLESHNAAVELQLRKKDTLIDILLGRDGVRLTSFHQRMTVPILRARIEQYHQINADGKLPIPERGVRPSMLNIMEDILEKSMQNQNDDAHRCLKQALFLFMLVIEEDVRKLFLVQPQPPHPFPQSREAVEYEAVQHKSPALANSVAFLSFLKEDLLPEVTNVVGGTTQRLNLQQWVADRTLAYLVRIPLDDT